MGTIQPTALVLTSRNGVGVGVWEAIEASGALALSVESHEGLGRLAETSPALVVMPERWCEVSRDALLRQVSGSFPQARRVLVLNRAPDENDLLLLATGGAHLIVGSWLSDDALCGQLAHQLEKFEQELEESRLSDMLRKRHNELEVMTRHLETQVERRSAQISRAKRELEMTFDAISDPLTLVDGNYVVHRCNRAAALVSGRDVRELPGSSCFSSLFGRKAPCDGCPLGGFDEGRGGVAEVADIVDERNGRVFSLNLFRGDADGGARRFICYYRDITEEAKLRKQVMQSEKMAAVGQLAGGVAHEINNPIGVILSFTQLSKPVAAHLGDEDLIDNLQEIEKAANRCKIIVRGLLDFSRPSADEMSASIDLDELMSSAWFLVSTQRESKSVRLEKRCPKGVTARGNQNQLLQVFVNIVTNAVHAMPDGGALILDAGESADGDVWASVEDTGHGIAQESLAKVFEPFFTTKAPGQGTGLGLSVSYGIVERHGGRIEVESQPGQGTRFTVHLPAAGN